MEQGIESFIQQTCSKPPVRSDTKQKHKNIKHILLFYLQPKKNGFESKFLKVYLFKVCSKGFKNHSYYACMSSINVTIKI